MPQYTVECRGEARELYTVEADSEEEAMAKWAEGDCYLTEVSSAEPVSARRDDD
jgi:hypothetical protein